MESWYLKMKIMFGMHLLTLPPYAYVLWSIRWCFFLIRQVQQFNTKYSRDQKKHVLVRRAQNKSTFQHLSRPCLNRGSARRLLRLPDGQDQNDGARTSTQRDRLSWRISAACWPRNPETLVTCTVVVDDDLVVETGPHAVQNEMFETGHFMDGELTQLVAEDMDTI